MSVKIKTEITVHLITSPTLRYATGLANQHVITTFTPDPELQQGRAQILNLINTPLSIFKNKIKVLSDIQ